MVNLKILIIPIVIAAIVAVAIAVPLYFPSDDNHETTKTSTNSSTTTITINSTSTTTKTKTNNVTQVLQQGNVTIYFIDVGQGDAIFVDTQDKDVLIDGGVSSKGIIVSNFLINLGINELDYIVATHPDADHIGGLITVMETFNSLNYPINNVLDNGLNQSSKTYQDYRHLADKIGITLANQSQTFQLDSLTEMIILYPIQPLLFSSFNDNSIVIMIQINEVSFLLTGDIGAPAEGHILGKNIDVSATVLKVGHHGSKYSTTKDFLTSVNSDIAVISVGNNNYGHPSEETITILSDFGIDVYRTDQHGTISITTNGSNYSVNTEKT